MKIIQIQGEIESISTRVDKTLKITLGTQELKPEDMLTLFELRQLPVHILVAQAVLKTEDLGDITVPVKVKGKKSASNRLRNVLFVFHEQQGMTEDFDTFYERKLESIIDSVKKELT